MNYRVQSRHTETDADGRTFAPGEVITDLNTEADYNKRKIAGGVYVAEQPKAEAGATDAAVGLAEESGVDLTGIEGTGSGGRITKDDVEAAIEAEAETEKGD